MKHDILYEDSLQLQRHLMDHVCKIFKFPLHSTRAIAVPGVCPHPNAWLLLREYWFVDEKQPSTDNHNDGSEIIPSTQSEMLKI
jgi:hypothetical protein